MQNQRNAISVVIPAYNAQETIEKCLSSIREQTLPAFEVIVIDDGSADSTVQRAQATAHVYPNTHGKGAGGARNTGAEIATGEIIAFLDSDCMAPGNWLQKIALALEGEGVGAVAGGHSACWGRSSISKFAFLELVRRRHNFPIYIETAAANNFAVKKEYFKKAGGFPEWFRRATLEDMVFSFRISRMARLRWLADNGVSHRFNETLSGYLVQQYNFGRDTVLTYYLLPELLKVKTHQGRLLYLEILCTGLVVVFSLLGSGLVSVAGICAVVLINLPLLRDCYKDGRSGLLLKSLVWIALRDLCIVFSIMAGLCAIVCRLGKGKNSDEAKIPE
jgi:glycosyltransferase involved in cell wall biosynthesis